MFNLAYLCSLACGVEDGETLLGSGSQNQGDPIGTISTWSGLISARYINNKLEEGRPVSSKSVYPRNSVLDSKFGHKV